MLLSMLSKGKGIPGGLGNKVPHLASAAIVFGYVLLLLAILVIEQSTARADALHADSAVPDQVVNQGRSPCEGSRMDSPLQGVLCEGRPIVYGEVPFSEETPFFAQNQGGDRVVWESNLTVGEASDSTVTYLGYGSGISTQAGSIDVTAFEYDDVTYTIENLFLQKVDGGIEQLVLNTDRRLPGGQFFQAGDDLFAISDAPALGLHNNILGWR